MVREVWTKYGYRDMSEEDYAAFVANPPETTAPCRSHDMSDIPLFFLLMIFMAAGFFVGYSL
jgi:hypothetical protein